MQSAACRRSAPLPKLYSPVSPHPPFHYTRYLTRITVQTPSRSYDVLVERGLLRSAATVLRELIPADSRIFVVTSPRIRKHWGSALKKSFIRVDRKLEILEMPDGERS